VAGFCESGSSSIKTGNFLTSRVSSFKEDCVMMSVCQSVSHTTYLPYTVKSVASLIKFILKCRGRQQVLGISGV
jgi:hypothetical protein